ncbi:MAG TPA: hypothetical protein VMR90_10140 [Candidatus Cybelea sp.]|nr:hypothetical protein [Candidatus Cybelea sp.]
MAILAFQKHCKALNCPVQIMRTHGIAVNGPYRRRNGALMFSVGEQVVSEDELLRFERARRLEVNKVHELLAEIGKRPT